MIENTENTTPITEVVYGPAYVDSLTRKVEKLEQELDWARKSRDNYLDTCNKVTKHIQDSIDREEWTDEELSEIFWEELAEMLDLELTKTVEIEITARWTATLKMPRSMSFDTAIENINIEEPTVSSYGSIEMDDVWERDCDITEA